MTDFRIRVIVDPSSAVVGQRRMAAGLSSLENRARGLGSTLTRTFAVLGIALGGAAVIGQLRGFGQEMSTVRAVTEATQSQFEQLRETALGLGETTRFSASEAAQGMTFLARAGFEVNEVMASIDDSLRLAQAGALSLASAADIASNVLTGFRLEADEAARVVDVIALAANSANTNVAQFGDAMKFVAPVAAGLGVEIEEAAAAVGALSDAGLQASLAGTGLRRVLSELESPSVKTRDIFGQLGVKAEEVRISEVGLTEALLKLRDAGVDTGAALEIFGDRGGPAFEVLASNIPKVIELTEKLENAEGTAHRIATTMDDNLNGALLAVRSAIEGVIQRFAELGAERALITFFRSLASGLRTVAANAQTVVDVFTGLTIQFPKFLTSLGDTIDGFTILGKSFREFRNDVSDLVDGFLELTGLQGVLGEFFAFIGDVIDANRRAVQLLFKDLLEAGRSARLLEEREGAFFGGRPPEAVGSSSGTGSSTSGERTTLTLLTAEQVSDIDQARQGMADLRFELEQLQETNPVLRAIEASVRALGPAGEEFRKQVGLVVPQILEIKNARTFADMVRDLDNANEVLALQIAGHEKLIPLLQIEQNLAREGITLSEQQRQTVAGRIEAQQGLTEALGRQQAQQQFLESGFDSLASSASSAFRQIGRDGASAFDILRDFGLRAIDQLQNALFELAFSNPLRQAFGFPGAQSLPTLAGFFGGFGGGGAGPGAGPGSELAGGGFLSGLFSGIGSIFGFQEGGSFTTPASLGSEDVPTVVGLSGRERVDITPAGSEFRRERGPQVIYNIDARGADAERIDELAAELRNTRAEVRRIDGEFDHRAVAATIDHENRGGGLD